MKKTFILLVLGTVYSTNDFCATQHDPFDDLNRAFEATTSRMEKQFNSMFERMDRSLRSNTQSLRLDTHVHNAIVTEDGAMVRVSIPVDKNVKVKDIIIDLDNGVLHVMIERPERVEIFIEDRWLTLTAERKEDKKESGNEYSTVSYASQQLTLPSEVDLSTIKADLTDGNLTLTFNKNITKNRQHVQVTEGAVTSVPAQTKKITAGEK